MKEATKLRESNAITKTILLQSKWERLALKNKHEFTTAEELDALLNQAHPLGNTSILH